VTVSPGAIDVADGPQNVTVTTHVTDDLSGTNTVQATLFVQGLPQYQKVALHRTTGDALDGTYTGTVTLPRFAATGAWYVLLEAADNATNSASTFTNLEFPDAHVNVTSDVDFRSVMLLDAPIAYWRLGDGRDTSRMGDETGHFPGAYKNGAGGSLQQGISGDGNTVAIFAGNGTYGYVNGLPAPPSGYTMEVWVNASDTRDAMIMQHGGGGALYVTDGKYAFRQVDTTVVASVGPNVGHFDQVAATWDGAIARIYVNGRLVGSAPSTKAPSGAGTFYIGYGELAPWFRGYLDEAGYFPAALAPSRIFDHFAADPPPPLLTPHSRHRSAKASKHRRGAKRRTPTG
jgi:hypothetical protein